MSHTMDWAITTKSLTPVSSRVASGTISCAQCGKIVRIDFNDIIFTGDSLTRWAPIANGAPKPAQNTGTKGILYEHGGTGDRQTLRIQVDGSNGDIALNYNANVKASAYYSGFLIYFAQ